MTSIRRTLSPVPRAAAIQNGEVHLVASPLSKSSTYTQNYPSSGGLPSSPFCSINSRSVLYRIQDVVCGIFTQRSSRHLDRTKAKGHVWKRAFFHFSVCFIVGILIGLTHFVSTNFSINLGSKHQAFTFEVIPPLGNTLHFDTSRNKRPLIDRSEFKDNASLEMQHAIPFTQLVTQEQDFVYRKLLIIVTPTYTRPFQAYYLNRLAHTLRLVSPPLLWIVVEMYSQSAETADILRKTGVMYRHLVCDRNITGVKDRSLHQRNMALFHIETHRLDGIVYFADDDNMYSIELFEQMREIRRLGTWPIATLIESKNKVILDGPVCNGSQVIGWHTRERTRRQRRFFVGMSGFAFNSTILWDPKRWHRPTLELIRQLDTVKGGFQESTFIEQLVEDESQMEGIPKDCSRIMVWRLQLESSHPFYPGGWITKKNLDVVAPLT